jgi:hypothetical protein
MVILQNHSGNGGQSEMLRQLFEVGVLQSGFWHQFAMTAHSPVLVSREIWCGKGNRSDWNFHNNDINYTDSTENRS